MTDHLKNFSVGALFLSGFFAGVFVATVTLDWLVSSDTRLEVVAGLCIAAGCWLVGAGYRGK